MLNRRHIRVKVLQAIYAMKQNKSDDIIKSEKLLLKSMEVVEDIYLLTLSIFFELRHKEAELLTIAQKKHLATKEDLNPNRKFVDNEVLVYFDELTSLKDKLEKKRLKFFKNNDDAIIYILQDIKASELYKKYMDSSENSLKNDLKFIIQLFEEVIAPNSSLYTIMEDNIMEWADDVPLVNSVVLKQLILWLKSGKEPVLSPLYKDLEDRDFGLSLLRKTIVHEDKLIIEFQDKTPNWDYERIALLDTIMMSMAVAELSFFPSIPVKVTINEYLEIAKEYSTKNSATFINGILDKIIKQKDSEQKFVKVGRGLI